MDQPSDLIIEMNMLDLARYALICQSEGLVPIVEPDVSLKGDHTLEQAVAINTKIQVRAERTTCTHTAAACRCPAPKALNITLGRCLRHLCPC